MQGNRTETVMFISVILGLLVCTEAREISAGTVFVLKGEDLLLNVTKAVVLRDLEYFSWRFNKNNVLVTFTSDKKKVFNDYTGRIEFTVNSYSLKLKNLQEADSGVYTAEVTKGSTEVLTEYNVKVQDRASLPLLTVSSVSDSSSSCSFTVTCSSQDSHINSTFTCDTRTCSQEGGERSEGIPDTFLQVHQSSGSIICNHSNHVSWTNNTKTIKDVCHQLVDPEGLSVCLVKTCVFSVGLIIMVSAVITVHLMEKLNKNK
ncbi:SLAM family member 7-like [Trematomus bernacchii]|uniref:SLAM family member 7-like n=1 Tax=Trematomus bernacchii TaxID=40690 RepID=UPI00146ABCB0|nr:SLAM family member 7-like [Trematomus bernacchii]